MKKAGPQVITLDSDDEDESCATKTSSLSPFLAFCAWREPSLLSSQPHLSSWHLERQLAAQWHALSDERKDQFRRRAANMANKKIDHVTGAAACSNSESNDANNNRSNDDDPNHERKKTTTINTNTNMSNKYNSGRSSISNKSNNIIKNSNNNGISNSDSSKSSGSNSKSSNGINSRASNSNTNSTDGNVVDKMKHNGFVHISMGKTNDSNIRVNNIGPTEKRESLKRNNLGEVVSLSALNTTAKGRSEVGNSNHKLLSSSLNLPRSVSISRVNIYNCNVAGQNGSINYDKSNKCRKNDLVTNGHLLNGTHFINNKMPNGPVISSARSLQKNSSSHSNRPNSAFSRSGNGSRIFGAAGNNRTNREKIGEYIKDKNNSISGKNNGSKNILNSAVLRLNNNSFCPPSKLIIKKTTTGIHTNVDSAKTLNGNISRGRIVQRKRQQKQQRGMSKSFNPQNEPLLLDIEIFGVPVPTLDLSNMTAIQRTCRLCATTATTATSPSSSSSAPCSSSLLYSLRGRGHLKSLLQRYFNLDPEEDERRNAPYVICHTCCVNIQRFERYKSLVSKGISKVDEMMKEKDKSDAKEKKQADSEKTPSKDVVDVVSKPDSSMSSEKSSKSTNEVFDMDKQITFDDDTTLPEFILGDMEVTSINCNGTYPSCNEVESDKSRVQTTQRVKSNELPNPGQSRNEDEEGERSDETKREESMQLIKRVAEAMQEVITVL